MRESWQLHRALITICLSIRPSTVTKENGTVKISMRRRSCLLLRSRLTINLMISRTFAGKKDGTVKVLQKWRSCLTWRRQSISIMVGISLLPHLVHRSGICLPAPRRTAGAVFILGSKSNARRQNPRYRIDLMVLSNVPIPTQYFASKIPQC